MLRSLAFVILVAGTSAACAGRTASASPAAGPPPVPIQPPTTVIPSPPVHRAITVCMLRGRALVNETATYNTATGDTTFASPGEPVGTHTGYAAGAPWYIGNGPITVDGVRYVKYGLPRVLAVDEVVPAGAYEGVPLFAETADTGPPEILYVPVRPGCELHPYVLGDWVSGVRG